MRLETPSDFFHVVSVGRRVAAMPAWGDVLSAQQRWDVVGYLFTLGTPAATVVEGQGLFLAHCAGCHGATGDGQGPFAAQLHTPVPDLGDLGRAAQRNTADLFAAISDGLPGTAMPGFGHALSEEQRWTLAAFVSQIALGGVARPARAEARVAAETEVLAAVRRGLAEVVDVYRRNDPGAASLATDAYLRFEPLEPGLAAADPALVTRIEEGFLRLRAALRQPDATADVERVAAEIGRELDAVEARIGAAQAGTWARFLQSATIILREGFEAVLVVGALLTYVTRAGQPAMRWPIQIGTVVGLVASLATAALVGTALRANPATAESLEGFTMLLASVMLFWVSYWIISKAEADRWQRYIRGKVEAALSSGSGVALGASAFLAVYREGFETVLFYQALLGTSPAGDAAVGGGLLVGTALLAVAYVLFRRLGHRLAMARFFLVTGALLLGMSITFAGQGVRELQAAGVLALTPLPGVATVPALGLFPTVETMAAQGVLLLLVLVGGFVTLSGRRHPQAPPPADRVRPLEGRKAAGDRR
jgi:high-affinity iron transporter